MQASAANSDNSLSASTHLQQNAKHPFYEFWKSKLETNYKIERYGRVSSRPWAQTVGWGTPTLFADQRAYQPNMNYYRGGTNPD